MDIINDGLNGAGAALITLGIISLTNGMIGTGAVEVLLGIAVYIVYEITPTK